MKLKQKFLLRICFTLTCFIIISCGEVFSDRTPSSISSTCQDHSALSSGYLVSFQCQALSWGNFPVKLHLDPNLPQIFFDAFDQATKEWNQELGFVVFELAIEKSTYNNVQILSSHEWTTSGGTLDQQARTLYKYVDNKFISTDIVFNGKLQFSLDSTLNSVHLPTLVKHELGHVLGLSHVDEGLMQTVLPNSITRHVSTSEIQKVQNLYAI